MINFFNSQKNVITAKLKDPLSDVLDVMVKNNIGCIVLLDDDDKVAGIFSERDALKNWRDIAAMAMTGAPVEKISTLKVKTLENDKKDRASVHMLAHKFRHIPITENGQLVDFISIRDVLEEALKENDDLRDELKKLKK